MLDSMLAQLPFDGSMLAILAAFLLTYWIARTFYFVPVFNLLEERAQEIAAAEEAHQSAEADVQAELEAQRAEMAEERAAARTERDAIRREAMAARDEMVAETQKLAEEKLSGAETELAGMVEAEEAKLGQFAQQLADAMAAKALRKAS